MFVATRLCQVSCGLNTKRAHWAVPQASLVQPYNEGLCQSEEQFPLENCQRVDT